MIPASGPASGYHRAHDRSDRPGAPAHRRRDPRRRGGCHLHDVLARDRHRAGGSSPLRTQPMSTPRSRRPAPRSRARGRRPARRSDRACSSSSPSCSTRARTSWRRSKAGTTASRSWQCLAELKTGVATLELFAGAAQHLYGRSHVVNPSVVTYTLREPVGVVGAIIPWNYPLMMAIWKVAPALAAGCTMVLKPASATPLSAIRLGELALEAGIPGGVLNVVTGPGCEVGEAIARHPGIDKVAFTGETAHRDGASRLGGGGDPQARLARARRQEPEPRLRRRRHRRGGARLAVGDLLLGRPVVRGALADSRRGWRVRRIRRRLRRQGGRRFASAIRSPTRTQVGSLISREHASKVRGLIDGGIDEGGELLAGGEITAASATASTRPPS